MKQPDSETRTTMKLMTAAMTLHASPSSLSIGGVTVESLDADDDLLARSHALLDEEEQARAARFVFDADRRRYIVAHARLRRVLAHELALDARAVRFTADSHGKPEIAADQNPHALRFNLSHSGN